MNTRHQDCPLCGDDAEYYIVDGQSRKHFLCSNCTQFQISVEAEARVARAPARKLKEAARAAGTVPLRDAAMALVEAGETTLEEINRVTFVA